MISKEYDEAQAAVTCSACGVAEAEDHLYRAECALHAAFESQVDAWISAAYDRLHEAIAEHTSAVALAGQAA